MRVICILGGWNLTKGKIYDVLDVTYSTEWKERFLQSNRKKTTYLVLADNNNQHWFYDDVLIPLDKWRETRLKSLID